MHLLLRAPSCPSPPGWSKAPITGDTLPKKFPGCEMYLPHYSVLYENNSKERGSQITAHRGNTRLTAAPSPTGLCHPSPRGLPEPRSPPCWGKRGWPHSTHCHTPPGYTTAPLTNPALRPPSPPPRNGSPQLRQAGAPRRPGAPPKGTPRGAAVTGPRRRESPGGCWPPP